MYKIFARNYLIFVILLLLTVGGIGFGLASGDRELRHTVNMVDHTHEVIAISERLGTLVESMLSAQRGYVITREKRFLNEYGSYKVQASDLLANAKSLLTDNQKQMGRINEIQSYMTEFTTKLEDRAAKLPNLPLNKNILQQFEIISGLKANIMRINASLLKDEYLLLNMRVRSLEERNNFYFTSLMIGMCCGTAIILIFNAFLLQAQRRRNSAETILQETEDRLRLAIEGTQDGIYDWDIKSNKIYFSRRFYEMMGQDRKSSYGTPEEAQNIIHPDDRERAVAHLRKYIAGELSEYSQEFRMQHASGRWIWIQSRGKALYDKTGKPYRMVGAHSDITSTVMTQERLKQEKQAAVEANRAKTDFLAHMSHEIRTPLTAISGIAEIFERNNANMNEKQVRLVHALSSSSGALKDLISDILDFSKIESGELELEDRPFMLDQLCQEIVSMMSLRANEKGVGFVFDYNEIIDMEFYGDKNRLRQIIVNLLGNAFKFTNTGGSVAVKVTLEDRAGHRCLRIDVSDTGLGIAAENYEVIFERFKQADSSVSRKFGGTGLGLPISKNLALMMNGDIFLSSELGKGSTFTFFAPMRFSGSNNTRPLSNDIVNKLNDQIRTTIRGETKILIVEDYEGNIVVMGYILDDIGISYDVAYTGVEALEKWKNNYYDIILMDVQMPEMDGFTATKEIRRLESAKHLSRTPIIGMTAHALVGDKDKCIEAGMDVYLPKPVVESDLKREILAFLDNKIKKA